MHPDHCRQLIAHLTYIDQRIREADILTTVPADDVLRDASRLLAELKETRRGVEAKLRAG
jgi:hypothetical protein